MAVIHNTQVTAIERYDYMQHNSGPSPTGFKAEVTVLFRWPQRQVRLYHKSTLQGVVFDSDV